MDYETIADELITMPWQARLIQAIGIMCAVITEMPPTAQKFKQLLKIVQQDLEQFNFSGSGASNIRESIEFDRKGQSDFLNDLYYPVVRLTARRAAGNSLPRQPLEYFNPLIEASSYDEVDNFILELYNYPDQELTDMLEKIKWIWNNSDVINNQP